MYTILICDDDKDIVSALDIYLTSEGYQTLKAYNGKEAIHAAETHEVHLILMDIMMPNLDGIRATANLRESYNVPIVLLTAKSEEDDTVMGLNIGADDYITKPFTIAEVIARVRAVLRRTHRAHDHALRGPREPDITFRTLRLDRNNKSCYIDGKNIDLTPREFNMLHFFMTHPERIHSREEIMNEVFGVAVSNRAVDTNITRLRKKLGPYRDNIQTRLGFGYGFKSDI